MSKNNPTHLIIHHSSTQSQHSQLGAINSYHKSLIFPLSSLGFFVGYHRHIAPNGHITATRQDNEIGAHTLWGWNEKSIGICLDGNFNKHAPTQNQLVALRGLIKHYNLPYMFHKDADNRRTCAGTYLTRDLIEEKPKQIPAGETDKAKAIQKHYRASQIAEKTGLPLQWVLNFIALGE